MTDTHTTPGWTNTEATPPPQEGHSAPQWFTSATGQPLYGAGQAPFGPAQDPSGSGQPPLPPTRPSHNGKRPSNGRRIGELSVVAVLAAALASGGTYAATQLGSQDTQYPSTAASSSSLGRGTDASPVVQADTNNPNWTQTAAAVTPSVVSITNQLSSGEAQGSGVIIDTKGHVLTNNHVVAGSQKLTVTLANGHTYPASIVGTDPSTDLAVVTIENAPSGLTPIALGDSASLNVGDPVMAVGNPLGLAGTVTTGIVSALNRPVTTQPSEQQQPVDPFGNPFGQQNQQQSSVDPVVTAAIQTSAAINPGNSGGALVNGSGQLVGINSAIASLNTSSSSQSGNIGIGFAIPVNEAKIIATQLIDKGAAEHAYLGVTLTTGTGSEGSATVTGAKIEKVLSGTPAAASGLKPGDLVIEVDGTSVESADSLIGLIRAHSIGDTVNLTVLRGGQRTTIKADLTTRPAASG
jgi:putative serine protease PepD